MQKKDFKMTSFLIPNGLRIKIRLFCVISGISMGEFIRAALREKIIEINKKEKNGESN